MMDFLLILAALAVLYKMLSAISSLSHFKWRSRKVQFSLLTASYAAMGAGAFGVAVEVGFGPQMLLVGLAGVMLIERRGAR